jgi:hypothetical protein
MLNSGAITIEVTTVDDDVMLVEIGTPIGVIEVLGRVTRVGRVLLIRRVHIDGLYPGALRRSGLNAICRKLM